MKYQQAVEYYIDYRLYFYLENTGWEVTDQVVLERSRKYVS